jgi:hypothetical protein
MQTPKNDPFVDQSNTVKKAKKFEIKSPLNNPGFSIFPKNSNMIFRGNGLASSMRDDSNALLHTSASDIPFQTDVIEEGFVCNDNWMDAENPVDLDEVAILDLNNRSINNIYEERSIINNNEMNVNANHAACEASNHSIVQDSIENILEINQTELSMMDKSEYLLCNGSDNDSTIPDQVDHDFSWDNHRNLPADNFMHLNQGVESLIIRAASYIIYRSNAKPEICFEYRFSYGTGKCC